MVITKILLKKNCFFFLKLKEEEKKEINAYIQNVILSSYFNFLRIFEENEQFKIVYEEKGKQVNLVEISEMLKAEPIIENGWIERFSEELKKGKDN
ncbi:hypothetical protein MWU65_16535 [Cellulophaga sp. F20128]|uniref:hypothetical protein n=1 Tax=Cellulophaga sp. F20128 TaxID=2926413 RepID=UPI001FF6329E|nr:hypothetical protein [Cellulophaga sp. F20128]MCK0158800.1 hypothetical protein [Cellulophaga sp. F20128]